MVFDDMMMQYANSELIAQVFTQKRHHHTNSSKLILPGKGNEKRTPQDRVRGVIS